MLVAILGAAGLLASAQPAADAAAFSLRSGTTGAIYLNGPMLTLTDTYAANSYIPMYQSAGVTVGRSAASSGAQNVFVQYALQRADGGAWSNVATSTTLSGSVSGAATVRFGGWTTNLSRVANFPYAWRINATVLWYEASTGRLLGYAQIVPSLNGEAVCRTLYRRCVPFNDGVRY